MTVKKSNKRAPASKSRSRSANGKLLSWQESIRRHLSTVRGIDAVYTRVDLRNVVHVTSVIKDHDSKIYDSLIPKEDSVEKENAGVFFDFHVCARQNRTVEKTIPAGCLLIFKKK